MMDLGTIRRLNAQSTRAAARSGNLPRLWDGDDKAFRCPYVGDRTPRGYRRTAREPLFVDTSGFGSTSEPALTQAQFVAAMTPGMFYGMTEHSQFQGYVAEFELTRAGKQHAAGKIV